MTFKNLAGDMNASQQILYELNFAKIPVFELPTSLGEVPSKYMGYLGIRNSFKFRMDIPHIKDLFDFTFERRWYYYVVDGLVPLKVAKEIYNIYPNEVRVNGNALGVEPTEKNVHWYDNDGYELVLKSELDKIESEKIKSSLLSNENYKFVNKLEDYGWPYIDTYHIDTQEGLNYFVKILRENYLVK